MASPGVPQTIAEEHPFWVLCEQPLANLEGRIRQVNDADKFLSLGLRLRERPAAPGPVEMPAINRTDILRPTAALLQDGEHVEQGLVLDGRDQPGLAPRNEVDFILTSCISQLVRVPDCRVGGCEFDSRSSRAATSKLIWPVVYYHWLTQEPRSTIQCPTL